MVGVDATLATALAIGFVGRLFGALGARRARVAVQLGAAAIGGTVFLLSQSQSLAPGLAGRLFAAVARPWPTPFDWPGRAALGAPLPLAAMVGLGAAALALAARRGGRDLVAAGDPGGGAAAARTAVVRFHPGLTRAIVVKELRLIARDPELISQIALRLVYLIPLAALVVRGSHGVDPGPALAAGATASAGLLASSLAWLVVAAEDAPDLLAAAPRAVATIARAKLIAATLVPAAVAGAAALGRGGDGGRGGRRGDARHGPRRGGQRGADPGVVRPPRTAQRLPPPPVGIVRRRRRRDRSRRRVVGDGDAAGPRLAVGARPRPARRDDRRRRDRGAER